MASLACRRLHCIRVRERHWRPCWPAPIHVARRCGWFHICGHWIEAGSAVVRIHVRSCGLTIGGDRPRPPDHPSSATLGLCVDGGMVADSSHRPSESPGEAYCHGFLLDLRSYVGFLHHLDAECMPEVQPIFPSGVKASALHPVLEPV